MPRSPDDKAAPLLGAYLERRADLGRFFSARLNSAAAAEDLLQDLYLKVCALKVDEEIKNPSAYLYRLATNLMLDSLRYERRVQARDDAWYATRRVDVGGEDVVDQPSAEDSVIARERLANLAKTIETLPPKVRRAFTLHKFEGLSHAETARAMGVSRSAVEKYIVSALKTLMETRR